MYRVRTATGLMTGWSFFNYIDHLLRLLLIKIGQGTSGTKTGAGRYTTIIQIIQFLFGKESVHHGDLGCHLIVVTYLIEFAKGKWDEPKIKRNC